MAAPCQKKRYDDKRSAQGARNVRMESARGHNRPEHLRIYDCPDCGGWHLAHGKATADKFAKKIQGPRYHRPAPKRLTPPLE